jgi:hypothetical protein
MKQYRMVVALSVILTTLFILPLTYSNAQAPAPRSPIAIRKIEGLKLPTPKFDFRGAPSNTGKPKEWFKIYVEYDTEPEWIDELNFTFYVLIKGKTKDAPPYSLFKAETSYIHIPAGSKHTADMYVHPNILSRYGDVERVAVEVRQGGRVLERVGKPALTEAWWERLSPIEGVLLNRSQTPFAIINVDDYEIIKSK